MGAEDVLFVLFGFKLTVAHVFTVVVGIFSVSLAAYKLIERWVTRKQRRLDMLREYLDKEEKDITARRPAVLSGIRLSEHAYLSDKKLDVGAEIDRALDLLDRGYPHAAEGKLAELEKRLLTDEPMLRKRADDLKRHTRSVRIFLGALADRENKPELGLAYIDKALNDDGSDLDALKYKALLLLKKGELDNAEGGCERLLRRANGKENACYRADAHLGIATVKYKRGAANFDSAMQSLATALTNINSVPNADQDHYTFAEIYLLQGEIYCASGWSGTNREKGLESYRKAKEALSLIPKRRESVETKIKDIDAKMGGP
jgi:tetratricopeptide (TPR) repeat protein